MVIGLAVAVAACSDASLTDLGSRSSGWIGDPIGGSGPIEVVDLPDFVGAGSVVWFNDELGRPAPDAAVSTVVATVAARASGAETYIQASRFEISVAVPGMVFPDVVPQEVEAVTSQLVIVPGGERLDDRIKAAFGLWSVEPYSKSRSVGQRGTFVVAAPALDPPCERLAGAAIGTCTFLDVLGLEVVRIDADSGQTWVWSDEQYEYQLFLRGSLDKNEEAALTMIGEPEAFTLLADPTVQVLGTQVTAPDQ